MDSSSPIKTVEGNTALSWLIDYLMQYKFNPALSLEAFVERRCAIDNYVESESQMTIVSRFYIYFTMLQLARRDLQFCELQKYVSHKVEIALNSTIPNSSGQFTLDGKLYTYTIVNKELRLGCGDDFTFQMYYRLCDSLAAKLRHSNFILRLNDFDKGVMSFEIITPEKLDSDYLLQRPVTTTDG